MKQIKKKRSLEIIVVLFVLISLCHIFVSGLDLP
jgi:hypothetical protein